MNDADGSSKNQTAGEPLIAVNGTKDGPPQQPATERQLQETELKIEERMSAFERSMVRLTRAAVIISIITGLIFAGQLWEMISGSSQTDKLVNYAKTQSEAASDMGDAAWNQVEAADSFADTSEDVNAKIGAAVEHLKMAADNGKKALDASIRASRLDQRAWIAVNGLAIDPPEVGKKLNGSVGLLNTGKTFARHVEPLCHFTFPKKEVETEGELLEVAAHAHLVGATSVGVIFPQGAYQTVLSSDALLNEADKERMLENYSYIWGEIGYYDVFGKRHTTVFCSWRKGASGGFVQCPFHNNAD